MKFECPFDIAYVFEDLIKNLYNMLPPRNGLENSIFLIRDPYSLMVHIRPKGYDVNKGPQTLRGLNGTMNNFFKWVRSGLQI